MTPLPNETAPGPTAAPPAPRVVAVVDIGATAIRMEVAEIRADASIRPLEMLQQAVRLGKDTFSRNRIENSTIRECIEILQGFRTLMDEYGIRANSDILAVATSSVREAINRDTFLDRIYNATGINVKIIDEAEESRLTFMAAQTILDKLPALRKGNVLLVEVGGGSTEVLLVQKGQLTFSNSYRMGSLRMRETLETYRASGERNRTILRQHINHTIEQALRSVPTEKVKTLLAIAGDARFAASRLDPNWDAEEYARLDLKSFAALTDRIVPMPVERLVSEYRLPYQEAETLGPALLAYVSLAEAFGVERILVPKTSLREGLLRDIVLQGSWTDAFAEQVIHSAVALGQKYNFDEAHALHVTDLALQLFQALKPEHRLDRHGEILLRVAGILHDVGGYISSRSHHKHSQYLILNSDLFGLSKQETHLVALVARYHRRAMPNRTHPEYAMLDRDSRIVVCKLAALLRIADALDRNHTQQVRELSFSREGDQFIVTVHHMEDLTLERLALKEKGNMFEEYYGLRVVLKASVVERERATDVK